MLQQHRPTLWLGATHGFAEDVSRQVMNGTRKENNQARKDRRKRHSGTLALVQNSPAWQGRPSSASLHNPLQYPCLENSMDRGARRATVHGGAKSRIRLSDLTHTPTNLQTHFEVWRGTMTHVPPGNCENTCKRVSIHPVFLLGIRGVIMLTFIARKFILILTLTPSCGQSSKPVPSHLVPKERKTSGFLLCH